MSFQMTKAGAAKGIAFWVTSVGNEIGQVLVSVLTAQEGPGLDPMVSGLIERYTQAGAAPPVLLYVDCGCCSEEGQPKLQAKFGGWPDLKIRLDIWHFMRRLAVGCTTDAHALYPLFMSRLSVCLFEWDAEDVALLRRVKREQLRRPLTWWTRPSLRLSCPSSAGGGHVEWTPRSSALSSCCRS